MAVKQRALRHVRDVFHWSREERFEVADVLAGAFGMAGPVLVGFLSGHEAAGFTAALGSLAANGVERRGGVRDHLRREAEALLPAILAPMVAIGLAASGVFSAVGLVLTVMIAALIGGLSRPIAVTSTRFIIILMILSAMPDLSRENGMGLLVLIVLGALWTSLLGLVFTALTFGREANLTQEAPQRQPSAIQRLRYLSRSLRGLAGWSYTLRLGVCLSVAAVLQAIWPQHHLHWIGLTVVLLTARQPEPNAVKTTQRTLGTGIGVLLAEWILRSPLPLGALVVVIGVLAGARRHFRPRNYLAYSVVMTLLIVVIKDAGQPPEFSLLADRLVATVIAGLLVTLSDWVFGLCVPTKPSLNRSGP